MNCSEPIITELAELSRASSLASVASESNDSIKDLENNLEQLKKSAIESSNSLKQSNISIPRRMSTSSSSKPKEGVANAARVSRGTEVDTWEGLSVEEPVRNEHEHLTISVVIYFTVVGGVPSQKDVLAAIDDMEMLYDACKAKGRLADDEFDFMKKELTVKDVVEISEKIVEQPVEKNVEQTVEQTVEQNETKDSKNKNSKSKCSIM